MREEAPEERSRQALVMLVPRGLDGHGGIERQMKYALAALGETRRGPGSGPILVLAPRGAAAFPRAAFAFVASFARYLAAIAAGRVKLIHINLSCYGSALRKFWFVLASRGFGIPIVLHLHGGYFVEFFDGLPSPLRRAVCWMFRSADRVVVLGDYWRAVVMERCDVESRRIVVLPNAVPAIERTPRPDGAVPHIVFSGMLGPEKGMPELLSALADPAVCALPWRATLAGQPESPRETLDQYRAALEARGLAERVVLTGWIEAERMSALLAEADLFVLPSHAENLPVALLEAMAAGLPSVVTPVGAIPETVADGREALFVPVGDAKALAAALGTLLADAALRQRLGNAARARHRACYAVAPYAERLSEIYAEVLRERGAGLTPEMAAP